MALRVAAGRAPTRRASTRACGACERGERALGRGISRATRDAGERPRRHDFVRGRALADGKPAGGLVAFDARDEAYMRRALEAAATKTAAEVAPNPLVGCVVVDPARDVVVGVGYHPKAGEPHAEVFALRAAGELARGATAYVTLEPCNHFGRTPPCARALVDAGVKRVVVGFVDPDPRVSGGGIQTLLNAGIEVAVGCEEARCREINAEFIARQEAIRAGK